MKIRTRDGIFKVERVVWDYFLGSGTWKQFFVVQEETETCPTHWPEELVLEVIKEEGER